MIGWVELSFTTVNVGDAPYDLEYNPSNEAIYVTNDDSGTVSVIDSSTNAVTATIDVGNGPFGLRTHPSNEDMYVTNSQSRTVSVIDGSTNAVTATIDVGDSSS